MGRKDGCVDKINLTIDAIMFASSCNFQFHGRDTTIFPARLNAIFETCELFKVSDLRSGYTNTFHDGSDVYLVAFEKRLSICKVYVAKSIKRSI